MRIGTFAFEACAPSMSSGGSGTNPEASYLATCFGREWYVDMVNVPVEVSHAPCRDARLDLHTKA